MRISPIPRLFSSYLLSTLTYSAATNMEKVNLDYSTKSIPLSEKDEYLKTFIEKTEHFIRRLQWKAKYFPDETEFTVNELYGFKSINSPPQISKLLPFEGDMTCFIQDIKFKDTRSSFQSKLNCELKNKMKRQNTHLIPADKTTNFYSTNPSSHDKWLKRMSPRPTRNHMIIV